MRLSALFSCQTSCPSFGTPFASTTASAEKERERWRKGERVRNYVPQGSGALYR